MSDTLFVIGHYKEFPIYQDEDIGTLYVKIQGEYILCQNLEMCQQEINDELFKKDKLNV